MPAWKEAFGARGKPERFYPHRIDFGGKPHLAERARKHVLGETRWGQTDTSWPLIYVSVRKPESAQRAGSWEGGVGRVQA